MSRVLILNENPLERENMREILSKGLPKPEVAAASSTRQALELLGEGGTALFIADVPWFDLE